MSDKCNGRQIAVLTVMAFSGLLLFGSGPAHAERFHALDPLPGHIFSWAYGVSADGNVVVGFSSAYVNGFCDNNCEAVRWVAFGAPNDLGRPLGSDASHALAVNADGSVVVG